jgi:allantoinase
MPSLIVKSKRVVTSTEIRPASIHIHNGQITAIAGYDEVFSNVNVIDVGNSVIMPGLVDTHVHINEPGRTDWEGFSSATRAAAAGGVTTLVDMPLNSIPTTTSLAALNAKHAAAKGQCWVNVAVWGGLVPGNTPELESLMQAGVCGFKCFLVPSGIAEFPNVSEGDLRQALTELKILNTVLLVHAEAPDVIERATTHIASDDPRRYQTFLRSRPRAAENESIQMLIRLCRELGARIHIVHLSSSEALPLLRQVKAEGLPVTVETCPHYLALAAEAIHDGATEFKCCPPIREHENNEKLWGALHEEVIDMIVSDHSPCPPEMKLAESGDFMRAWGGIASLQLGLPIVWTHAKERGFDLHDLTKWMSHQPGKLAKLDHRKGALNIGYDADLVIWNPEQTFLVESTKLHHKHKLTPYHGQRLNGVVEMVFVRGQLVYEHGKFSTEPTGHLLLR